MKIVVPGVLMVICFSVLMTSCFNKNEEPVLSFYEQWAKDTTAIGSYLRSKNITALTDASGVRFVIESVAPGGFPPRSNSAVSFKYKGTFLSETIFDQGEINGTVSSFIAGFQVGLSMLPEGSKGKFYIPSGYGYGTSGAQGIPPNANLIFEIELTDVATSEVEKQQLAKDTVDIDEFLATNSINAIHDKTGLRYVINQLGTGPQPTLYSKVKINYTGKLLSTGTAFFSGAGAPSAEFDSRVINYLYAFQAALPKMPVGSKATLYIPSGLGFGAQLLTNGGITVPANSNLIYEIELVEIVK